MTEEEIRINVSNVLLAEFKGWILCECGNGFLHYKYGPLMWQTHQITGMKFHTSWDWFMPVYRQFKDKLTELHKTMPPHTALRGDSIEVDIHCAVASVDLPSAFLYLVQGVKWYNEYIKKINPSTANNT